MSEPRFELLDDYSRELDREADLIVPPTSPAEVRRAGTSRDRRRLIVLGVILVCLALSVGGVVLANLTSRRAAPDWATTASPTPTTTATTSTTTPSASEGSATTPAAASASATKSAVGAPSWALCGVGIAPSWALDGTTKAGAAANPMTMVLCGAYLVVSTSNSEPSAYYVSASTLYGVTAVLETFSITVTDVRKDQTVTIRDGSAPFAIVSVSARWVDPAITGSGSVQPVVASGDVVTMQGVGELAIGMRRGVLVNRSVLAPVGGCTVDNPIPTLTTEGISISSQTDTVDFIHIHSPQHPTQSGVAVGMTMGKVKQVYGDKVAVKTVTLQIGDPQGNTRQAYVISSGNTLVFMSDSRSGIQPSDVVTSIALLKGDQSTVPVEIC